MNRFFVLLVLFLLPFLLLFLPPHRDISNSFVFAQGMPDGPKGSFAGGGGEQSPLDMRLWAHPGSLTDSVQEVWVARYNGFGDSFDDPTRVAIDASGNVYVVGLSGGDCATIKYSASGQELWVARYDGGGVSGDWANALALDHSGNVYVTGYTSVSFTSPDYLTIKYDSSGQEQWAVSYNGPGNYYDEADDLGIDDEGNVYVTGYSVGSGTLGDYATIKYDASGQEQWVARYNGPGNGYDEANALVVAGSGNVYVTGYSPGSGTGFDYTTIKYDGLGHEQWVTRYDGPGSGLDYAFDLVVDGSGDVFVTGVSGDDYATIKYDASGQEQWVARYDGGYLDYATALAIDASGNVSVTGYSSHDSTSEDYATIRYDTAGQEQWVARYNGPGNSADHASALVTDASGNLYVTGFSYGSGTGNDYATIKYDVSGEEQWVARYDAEGSDDVGTALAIDGSGNVYVTGLSLDSLTGYDFATIKYEEEIPTGVGSEGGKVPREYSLTQNYPNPFNPSTTFSFSIPQSSIVNLKVFDLIGQEVVTIVNEKLDAGSYSRQWDATGQPSGVYFYRLSVVSTARRDLDPHEGGGQAGGFTETKKLILLR